MRAADPTQASAVPLATGASESGSRTTQEP